jgi:hypothetical protein
MTSKILLLLLAILSNAVILTAQVIHVDINNNTGIEDGTEAHPFNTIKEGINAAVAGTQVMIKKGTYVPDDSLWGNPHTLLLKPGVTLVGESCDNTIIAGIVVDGQAGNLSIGLEKLRFDEFHFTRATHAGPFPDRNIIRECATDYIGLAFGAGIPVNDTTPGPNFGFLIENNDLGTEGSIEFKQGAGVSFLTATGNTCGYIQLKSGGGYTYLIDHNEVQYAIFDKSGANTTTISGNTIFNGMICDKSGSNGYGIEDEIIEYNTITADENSPAFADEDYKAGILVSSGSATIRSNTISCTGNVSGIRSKAGAPLHLVGNTIVLDEVTGPAPDPYEATIGIMNYSGWGYVTGNKIRGGNMGYFSKAGTIDFSGNEIEAAWTGFYSQGAEEVHYNIIQNCKGDGMILDGLRGPLSYNMVVNNAGAGIRVIRVPVDLGGGEDGSPGKNTIRGNGNYDLYIETTSSQYPVIFARNNLWDHEDAGQIAELDIRDSNDSTGLVTVDFTPWGGLGIGDRDLSAGLNIYPNPASGSITIDWRGTMGDQPDESRTKLVVKIFDFMGKDVITLVYENGLQGEQPENLDVSCLPRGVYLCRIRSGDYSVTRKIVLL